MGVDAGFDLYPPLTTEEELKKWEEFLKEVQSRYQNCPFLESNEAGLKFNAWECPRLPWDGRFFRRFGSTISGGFNAAYTCIEEVFNIAKKHFGMRVQLWSFEPPYYGWNEVYEADNQYYAELKKKKEEKEKESTATDPAAAD